MARISYNGRRLVAVVKQARAVDAFKHQQQKSLANEARREFSDIFTDAEKQRLSDEFFIAFLKANREDPDW